MMFDANKLLLTLVDAGGGVRARYAVLKGRTVQAEGECALTDLPASGAVRAAFLARGSYFDRVDAEVRSAKMLPFQARRLVDGALAFNEPFRVRCAARDLGNGRKRLDLLAVAEAEYAAAHDSLATRAAACERLAPVEAAIAALVAQETPEPAAVLWQRGANLLGLLVENGAVLTKVLDRAVGGETADAVEGQAGRLERMRGSLRTAARRTFPDREISLHLALGELAGKPEARGEKDGAASSALETRLARRFTGGQPNAALQWPEVYGLLTLANDFSLLEPERQQRAWAEKAALALGAVIFTGTAAATATAAFSHAEWQRLATEYDTRRGKVEAENAALKPRLPDPAQLAVVSQQVGIEGGAADFRIDSLLAWISEITPRGAIIRKLEAGAKPGGAPAAPAGTAGATPPAALPVSVEWELQGDYPETERLAALLAERLGARTKLSGSALTYTPGETGGSTARLTTTLAPLPGAFRQ